MNNPLVSIIRKVLSYFQAVKLRAILSRFESVATSEEERTLIRYIGSRQFENAVGLYALHLENMDISTVNKFLHEPGIKRIIKSAKARYREFFIALHKENDRKNATRFFYEKNNERVFSIRRALLKKINNISEDPARSFFESRLHEWQVLFPDIDIPFTGKKELMEQFDDSMVSTDERLFQAINNLAPQYFFRKLLLPNMMSLLLIKEIIQKHFENQKLQVLDFGCGCGDHGLYCALQGHDVSVCDVEGLMLNSVIKRFEMRNIQGEFICSTPEIPIPHCEGIFDLIIAREVLEHVRYPVRLLEQLDAVGTKDSCVVLGSFPFRPAVAVGDHLIEAISEREQLLNWIASHWKPIRFSNEGYVFCKR